MCCCGLQIAGEIERSDIPYEDEDGFEAELSEDIEQDDRDRDVHDDLIVVGQLWYQPIISIELHSSYIMLVLYYIGSGLQADLAEVFREG